ncbi:MAG: hypothetical protein ACUVX8_11080 [Candidatus Zipacnadales bacterium]
MSRATIGELVYGAHGGLDVFHAESWPMLMGGSERTAEAIQIIGVAKALGLAPVPKARGRGSGPDARGLAATDGKLRALGARVFRGGAMSYVPRRAACLALRAASQVPR